MSVEYFISHKCTLKILCKSEHFPRRYKRKREWVFFSEHSVYVHVTVSARYDGCAHPHIPNICTAVRTCITGWTVVQALLHASYASTGIARAEMSICPSVRPSVYLSHSGIVSKRRKLASRFLYHLRARTYSFWKYLVHHEIRKETSEARAIYKTVVGKNWQLWRFFDH